MKTKILILSANPKSTKSLRINEEVKKIKAGVNHFNHEIKIEHIGAVTIDEMRRKIIEFKPNILHFSGHGDEDGISLEEIDGKKVLVSGESLSEFFNFFSDHIKIVLLNSCYSEKQAKDISKYIDYVIGMKEEINDDAAITFSLVFYESFAAGMEVEKCFRIGKNAIKMKNLRDEDIPILSKKTFDLGLDTSFSEIEKKILDTDIIKNESTNLFREIYKIKHLTKTQEILINDVIRSPLFSFNDRIITVNALTLSCLFYFSNLKIKLLIKFLPIKNEFIQHEALVGIFLILLKRKNYLNIEIIELLKKETHENTEIQKMLSTIFPNIYNNFFDNELKFSSLQKVDFEAMKNQLNYIYHIINLKEGNAIGYKNSKFEFINLISNNDALGLVNFLRKNGNNPLKIEFNKESFLKNPEMWFYPFDSSLDKINKIYSNDNIDFDLEGFLNGLIQMPITNIEKYFLAFNFDNLDSDTKYFLSSMQNSDIFDLVRASLNMYEILDDDEFLYYIMSSTTISKYFRFYNNFSDDKPFSFIFDIEEDDKIFNTTCIKYLLDEKNMIIREADFYYTKKKYSKASEIYETIYNKYNDEYILIKLVDSLYNAKDFKSCVDLFKDVKKKSNLSLNIKMAKIFIENEHFDKAKPLLLYNLSKNEYHVESLNTLGLYYYTQYDFINAIKYYKRELNISPSNSTRFLLVNLYIDLEYFIEAKKELKLIEINSVEIKNEVDSLHFKILRNEII